MEYSNQNNPQAPEASPDAPLHGDRDSWKTMIQRLSTDVATLVEKEGQLIRTEISEKMVQLKTGTAAYAAAGLVLLLGALSLPATAVILLMQVMPLWLSAVVVTLSLLVLGAILLSSAKKKMDAEHLLPRKSINSLSEIRFTLKEKVNEITKH